MASVSVQSFSFEGFGSASVQASASSANGTTTSSISATGNFGNLNAGAAAGTGNDSSSSALQITGDTSDGMSITTSAHSEGNAIASVGASDGNHVVMGSSATSSVLSSNGSSSASSSATVNGVYDEQGNFVTGTVSTETHADGNAQATANASNGSTAISETTHSGPGEVAPNSSEKEFVYHVEIGGNDYNYSQFYTADGMGWSLIGENTSTHQFYLAAYPDGQDGAEIYRQLKDLAEAWASHGTDSWFVPEGAHVMQLAIPSSDAGLLLT
ncbi:MULTISPECIES: hypothetical protein [unclassified Chelatococcus]|uniref:hypothetical protein n=1 Tax=unclassified Chelatococcus TaxID=2638111 RepID=UPI001BCDA3AC|nr:MULTISPECIES: hypothetical protein [unclassified Chelatococcus]MBS7697884.1 hypothetical protein [Chelatococcus sp. YT9]MBX3558539.1 hypothetical protein [Chelatococcus sp.]